MCGRDLFHLVGASALRSTRLGRGLRVLRGLEVGMLCDGVEQDGDAPGDSCERDLARLAVGHETLVELAENVIVAACGNGSHVESLLEVGSASARLGLVLDRAAFVVERGVAAHLGDALGVEVSDVGALREDYAGEAGPHALDLAEAPVELPEPLVGRYCGVTLSLDLGDVLVEAVQRALEVPRSLRVEVVLELVGDDRAGLEEVLPRPDGLLEAFLGFGAGLDEVQLLVLEGCRVVADHLAVDGVRLLEPPLGLRELARPPCVEAHGLDAAREAFVGQRLLVGAGGLERDECAEFGRLLDHFCPAGPDVSDCFLLSAGVTNVELFLADVDSHYLFGRLHDILSLSSSYRDLVSRTPFQPYRLWLMTKRRCPDSPARSKPLGGNGLTAAARVGWPSFPGILFASTRVSAIPTPVGQEQLESISQRG